MGSVQDFILLFLCLVWIKIIRRQWEFRIPLCNPSGEKLLRQNHTWNLVKHQRRSSSAKAANGLNTLTVFGKIAPPQTSNQIPNADPNNGVVIFFWWGRRWTASTWNWQPQTGVDGSGWGSNYKKSYFWWLTATVILLGVAAWEKQGCVSSRLVWGKREGGREKRQFDLVCGALLDDWANAGLCWCLVHVWWVWF